MKLRHVKRNHDSMSVLVQHLTEKLRKQSIPRPNLQMGQVVVRQIDRPHPLLKRKIST